MNQVCKRTYHKPSITEEIIDSEISLVMMTYTDPDTPPPPVPGAAAASEKSATKQNSFNENPFGE